MRRNDVDARVWEKISCGLFRLFCAAGVSSGVGQKMFVAHNFVCKSLRRMTCVGNLTGFGWQNFEAEDH